MESLVIVIGHLHHSSIYSFQELNFLFFYVMPMLENIGARLGNIVTALGGLMTMMGTLSNGFKVVYKLF